MSNVIRSTRKFNNAQWPGGFAGLYPSNLISAFFFNEAGFESNAGGDAILYDAIQRSAVTKLAGTNSPVWTTGPGGAALFFNNATQLTSAFTRALDPKTWAFWILPTSTQGAVAGKNGQNITNEGWMVSTFNAPGVQLIVVGNVTRNLIVQTANVPANWTTAWHHVAISWNGLTNTGAVVNIYIDGILRANTFTQTDTVTGTYTSDAGKPLNIANSPGAGTDWFGQDLTGTLESLFMFGRALSQAEIVDLMLASYRWYTVRKAYAIVAPSQTFTATAVQKAATLGRKIFLTLAASAHTKSATLTTVFAQFKTLAASAHTKAGALTTFLVPNKLFAAQMLQRSGTLGRKVFKTLSATKSTCQGVLTTIKAAAQKTLISTASTKQGVLNRKTFIQSQLSAVKARNQGKLTMAVQHGPLPPSVCTPVACPTVSTIISHVEQCENPGS